VKPSAKRTANAVNSTIAEASCPFCVSLVCRAHLTRRREEKTLSPLLARRASLLESAKGWLGKWKAAEARLKRAKTQQRVAVKKARTYEAFTGGWPDTSTTPPSWKSSLTAAVHTTDREVGLAIADVEKKRDSFANCMRWMLEGK